MLNIYDLEKRWKRYKIKSLLPYITIGISLFIIFPITYNFYTNSDKKTPPKKQLIQKKKVQTVTIPKKKKVHVTVAPKKVKIKPVIVIPPQKKVLTVVQAPVQIQKLQPSMNFIKNIQDETSQTQYIVKKRKKVIQPKVTKKIIQNITPKIAPVIKKPKVAIIIERKETQNDIFEVIKRFKENNNPALSLFVAKKYYELGNYEQSYNYALITNQINSNIEASWIVFAKSLVKLHKKNKAIRTLQAYINVSHSNNAEILLDEITSGKFK